MLRKDFESIVINNRDILIVWKTQMYKKQTDAAIFYNNTCLCFCIYYSYGDISKTARYYNPLPGALKPAGVCHADNVMK